MKICILSTSYPRHKDDHWVPFMHYWAKELAKTEDVTVVASGGYGAKEHEVIDNVKIFRFAYFYPKSLQRLTYGGGMRESFKRGLFAKLQSPFFMLAFLIKSLKVAKNCDVINAHWTLSGLVSIPIKIAYKKPVVLTEHGGGMRGLPRWLNKLVFKRMDAITSAHHDMVQAIKAMGISNVYDIKNFLDEDRFLKRHGANFAKSIKKGMGIKDEKVVTFIGRFEDLKDPLTFVGSIHYAIKENANENVVKMRRNPIFSKASNVKFIMMGDGHLKEEIKKQLKKLGIESYVIMPAPSSNVDRYLAISDIFVACSAVENCFSTTILEAMLSKVPCIVTKAGMTERFFAHGKDAYLVEKESPELLGKAIAGLLKDARLRKKLSENGLKFLERHGFRNKAIRERIMEVFNAVVRRLEKKRLLTSGMKPR